MKINRIIAIIMTLWAAVGCSGLLYYPTHSMHADPARYKIQPEDVWFENASGIALNGWFFKNRVGRPKGTIVFFHGNGENITSHYQTLLWILDHGYDFFIFDYQGYGKSKGSPSPKGTVEDGVAALEWAARRAAGTPLVVFGQSLGGAVALKSVIDNKDRFAVALVVVESTFPSYQGAARKVMSSGFLTWLFQPLAYLLFSDKQAPGKDIVKISPVPLVVIHGNRDGVVDFELGKKVFEYANEPKEFWTVEGGGHIEAFWRFGDTFRPKLLAKLKAVIEK
jgi:uncharacterized protein